MIDNTNNTESKTNQSTHQGIKVYPNPANNYVTVEVDTSDAGTILWIYDIYGRTVVQKNLNGQTKITISTIEWNSGIFIWTVRQNEYPVDQGRLEIIK